jgi:hypothetical protein
MISGLIACISAFFSAFSRHCDLTLENLALKRQLAIFKRSHPRPRLRPTDRLFWVWLSKIWTDWREALIIVKPEKDAPEPRAKQPPELGVVIEIAEVSGLRHRYERRAA